MSATARVKYSFSKQHLRAAELFAAQARTAETNISSPDEVQRSHHRAYVTAAILSGVAFLEASINELYLSALDKDRTALPSFNDHLFELFAQFWLDVEKSSILNKYQVALALATKPRFDKGGRIYQEAETIVQLRNCLVHYQPEWDDELGRHQKLESRLSGKFDLNPYVDNSSLWFPHQCLSAACAEWCVRAVLQFADEFSNQLQIPSRT
jgi:hypothetical protein